VAVDVLGLGIKGLTGSGVMAMARMPPAADSSGVATVLLPVLIFTNPFLLSILKPEFGVRISN